MTSSSSLRLGRVHRDVPVVAVPLELRALVGVAEVVERERVDRELLGELVELRVGEVDRVDDEQRALPAARVGEIARVDGLAAPTRRAGTAAPRSSDAQPTAARVRSR